MRQIDTYETELGWAFWTYKLDDVAEAGTACYPMYNPLPQVYATIPYIPYYPMYNPTT